ncbi:MAG: sugar ABC transporter ATP-binding protein [Bacteroidota bacterium]
MLRLQDVSKSFPGVHALKNISITFHAREVHALCGENGAGKSTLMHIIAGSLLPDSGKIYWNGEAVQVHTVQHAQLMGIGIVYQEDTLAGSLTVAENIFPVNPPRNKIGLIDYAALHAQARQLLEELGQSAISSKARVDILSPASKQMVEIARALAQQPSLLILDEPTASLTTTETNILFTVIRKLVKKGTGIIYISHRMAELPVIADTISVLKDGEYQGSFNAKQTSAEAIVAKMVGRVLEKTPYISHAQNKIALEVQQLCGDGFRDISFTLYKGEIFGIAGLEGSGRTALAKTIFGDKQPQAGKLLKDGSPAEIKHPADAIAAGIAYLPEERKALGLFASQDIASNIGVASMHGYWYNYGLNSTAAKEFVAQLGIKIRSVTQNIQELSGGNQQKVVLAKWLRTNPDVLIINEPTHGVDVAAKAAIYELLKKLTAAGKSILLISSDLTELLLISDRVMVMYNGSARTILQREEMTEEKIAALASGI